MKRLTISLSTAFILFAALLGASAASAQTVASVAAFSGNGQLINPPIAGGNPMGFYTFEPLVVKVTDANGAPLAGIPVTWSLVQGTAGLSATQTVTNENGFASMRPTPGLAASVAEPYVQHVIAASAGFQTATFYVTQLNGMFTDIVQSSLVVPASYSVLSGSAGAQGATPIQVQLRTNANVLPRISVRLVNASGLGTPAATCATSEGADPGSVLTDADGLATCVPIFGTTVGENQPVELLVGGVYSSQDNPLGPGLAFGLASLGRYFVSVTPSVPGLITATGGNNQSANPGQPLAALLQVRVTDAAGLANIAGETVQWTVTPSGAATLGSGSTTTTPAGISTNSVRLASNAVGQITVTAALASNPSISTTFTVTANAVISNLQKLSGDQQTAVIKLPFAAPLVVQANGTNGPLAGAAVQFAVSGPATLSATSATTGANGRAQVTVTAGVNPGAVTVTATIGSMSQTFNLTVVPEGPQVDAFTNGAQFYTSWDANHSALSPCSIGTVFGRGLAPLLQGVAVPSAIVGPQPFTLSGVSISFNGSRAPLFNVANIFGVESATFQVPCDVTPGAAVPVTINANGGVTSTTTIVRRASPGIFETNVLSTEANPVLRAVLVKPDGSYVSTANPARRGEIIRMYATGLGATTPSISGTGALPPLNTEALVRGLVIVGINNQGVRVVQSRLSPNLLGVYEVDFEVPSNAPAGNDVVLSLAVNAIGESATQFSLGSRIPIQ